MTALRGFQSFQTFQSFETFEAGTLLQALRKTSVLPFFIKNFVPFALLSKN